MTQSCLSLLIHRCSYLLTSLNLCKQHLWKRLYISISRVKYKIFLSLKRKVHIPPYVKDYDRFSRHYLYKTVFLRDSYGSYHQLHVTHLPTSHHWDGKWWGKGKVLIRVFFYEFLHKCSTPVLLFKESYASSQSLWNVYRIIFNVQQVWKLHCDYK